MSLKPCAVPIVWMATLLCGGPSWAGPEAQPASVKAPSPTPHPPMPRTLAEAWLVPDPSAPLSPDLQPFAAGLRAFDEGRYAEAEARLSEAGLARTELGGYARYFSALSQLKQSRPADARRLLTTADPPPAQSALAALWVLASAEATESAGDPAAAASLYARAVAGGPERSPAVLARLARVAAAAGDHAQEEAAILRLYVEHPASDEAKAVEARVTAMREAASPARLRELDDAALARAERLYSSRLYREARAAFAAARPPTAEARDLAGLRLGECAYFLKDYRGALNHLQPHLASAERQAEARHYHALSLRRVGRTAESEAAVRRLADEFPGTFWAQEALAMLASHHLVADQDDRAIATFERILREYPTGRHAERAAWKVGWWRYRQGSFGAAAAVFERAAVAAPRADFRPAWLYWAGRARERLGDTDGARAMFQLVITDYRNSYYGRLVQRAQDQRHASVDAVASAAPVPGRPAIPTAGLIRALIATGQHALALDEVEFARQTWGPSPQLDATLAYVHTALGDLRRGPIYMKRAYPQYLAAGGERLPIELRRIIFPLDYTDLIATYSRSRGLDPSLVSALIAQESAFQADVRSAANAYGLMQIVPRTGRRLARQDGLARFSTRMLVDPTINVRLGTRYFSQLLEEFPGVHFALAGYNAGESRVRQWRSERGDLPAEEFIDDIPFPETQGYVKRILSMVEDYRELYGATLEAAARAAPDTVAPASNRPGAGTKKAPARRGSTPSAGVGPAR